MEDKADVFCVYCSGEVMEKRFPSVSPLTTKQLHQERLEEAEEEESLCACVHMYYTDVNTRSDRLL